MSSVSRTESTLDAITRGAMMNGRVLVALIFREAAMKFGSGPMGYLWTLIEPAVFVGIMLLMRVYVRDMAPSFGDSSLLFLLTGVLTFRLTRAIINKGGRAIIGNRTMFAFGAVKPPDVVIARTVMEFTLWLLVLALFFFGVGRVINETVITNFQGFVIALLAIFYFCLAGSMFNATVGALVPVWRTIWKLLSMPMLFISGVIYVPSEMPPEVQNIIYWSPFLHCIEGIRQNSYLDYISLYDPIYLNSFSTIMLLFSLTLERLFRREIIKAKSDEDDEDEFL